MTATTTSTTNGHDAGVVQRRSDECNIRLIAWDPTNEEHFERMVQQRLSCGWDSDAVGVWKKKLLDGNKFMYWVILKDEYAERQTLLDAHNQLYPKERAPIKDTATVLGNSPLTPTHESFVPIGHVAIDRYPERNEVFGIAMSTIWIKSLYISKAMQTSGLGIQTMRETERVACLPPLNASALALDTTLGVAQKSEAAMKAFYDDVGAPRPKKMRSNQEWYTKQGYTLMDVPETDSPHVFKHYMNEYGKGDFVLPTVWMYKAIQ